MRGYVETLRRVLAGEAQLRSLDGRPGGKARRAAPSPFDLSARALTFLPAFEAFAPHLVEEIRGVGEGAGVPFAAALLVNVRAEVAGVRPAASGANLSCGIADEGDRGAHGARAGRASSRVEGCTAFAAGRQATDTGEVLLGQNQDQAPEMEDFGVVLRVRPDDGPPMLMATFGGLVGYPGLNGAGVAFFQNALSNGVWRHALPHYPLKRALLEQRDVAACLGMFDRAALASCGNYVLGDRTGRLLDVEATPEGYASLDPEDGLLVHTNHFQSARFRPHERLLQNLPDSAPRLTRMRHLLQEAHGRISVETIKRCLRDHAGEPAAICRHEVARPMATIASIIAEPDQGRLHVARGNPCQNEYVAYTVE